MKVLLKGNGEKGNWFIVIDGKIALRFKDGMSWKEMMEVTKVVEDNIVGLHVKEK